MSIQEVIQQFYIGLARKDDSWQHHLSDEVVFSDASGMLHAEGKVAFFQSFRTFLRGVKNVQLKQLITEGENACAVVSYEYVSRTGATMSQDDAEVWHIVDGKIVSLTIYFDITAFRAFMGR